MSTKQHNVVGLQRSLLAAFTSLLWLAPSVNASDKVTTKEQKQNKFQQGCAFARIGNWKDAVDCFLDGAIFSPERAIYWRREVQGAVKTMPQNPKAHAALGLTYRLAKEFEQPGKACGKLGDYNVSSLELKQAISLTPQGMEGISITYLGDNIGYQRYKKTRPKLRRNLLQELLFYRWCPLANGPYNLAWLDETGCAIIPSASPNFNETAASAFSTAISDFPEVNWSGEFLFASEGGSKSVTRVDPGCIGQISSLMKSYGDKSFEKVQNETLNYMKTRWTTSRVRDYCRPETSLPPCMRLNFVNGPRGDFDSLPLSSGLPKVSWEVGLHNGKPYHYVVKAERGNCFWFLENGFPCELPANDDEFLRQRLSDSIFLSIKKFELANLERMITGAKSFRRKASPSNEKILRDSNSRIVGFSCNLSNGSLLLAELNNDLSILSINVDGKRDEIWSSAIEKVDSSNAELEKFNFDGSDFTDSVVDLKRRDRLRRK